MLSKDAKEVYFYPPCLFCIVHGAEWTYLGSSVLDPFPGMVCLRLFVDTGDGMRKTRSPNGQVRQAGKGRVPG